MFFPQEMNEVEKQNWDIGIRLTCVVKRFCMWKKAYSLCKYKAQGFQETYVVVLHHVSEDLLSQKM
jgi:hypothetical protein